MTELAEHGYYWIETTTALELGEGQRTFIRGPKISPDVEPWTIKTAGGVLTAWIDQDNQNRWRHPGEGAPADWRRLYVEKR